MTRWIWVSSRRMTVLVEVDGDSNIVTGPPIVRRFIGQWFCALTLWMSKQGGLRAEVVS